MEDEIPDRDWTQLQRVIEQIGRPIITETMLPRRDETQLNASNRRTAAISFGFKGDECKCLCARSQPNKRPRYVNHRSRPQTVPDQLIGTHSNWSTSSGVCARNACRAERERQQQSPSDVHDPIHRSLESFLSSSSFFLSLSLSLSFLFSVESPTSRFRGSTSRFVLSNELEKFSRLIDSLVWSVVKPIPVLFSFLFSFQFSLSLCVFF